MELNHRDIAYCKGVGTKRADILRMELGVRTAMDMLMQFPYKYIDRTRFYRIAEIQDDDTYVQIVGEITEWKTIGVGKMQRLSALFSDGQHQIELVWFKGVKYVQLQRNIRYLLFGKPTRFNHQYNFVHPELTPLDKVSADTTKGLEPHYNTTEKMKLSGLNSKAMRTIIAGLIPDLKLGVADILSADILQRYHLVTRTQALINIHFPSSTQAMQQARERLKFEELFYSQLQILSKRKRHERLPGMAMPLVGEHFHTLYKSLPFALTNAQKRVIREIHADLGSGKQMNRLLQGDVGSGKTLVALLSCLLAIDNGYQTCIMAPTEILANQHLDTLNAFVERINNDRARVKIELLTGSTSKRQREELLPKLEAGEIDILIGTHALLEDTVKWGNLGLVIVDEQHRFGVAQRSKLWHKNTTSPHVLVMTATPIPRTLAMTLYGDLQVSIIDELPPGRKPVQTQHYSIQRRVSVNQFIRQQVDAGRQVYVVYPIIQENEKLDLLDLQNGYNELRETFPEYKISMVHGQMKAKDKEEQMQRFVQGETQILVATTVIEVGVNVPNASVMIIENAERFGLSQLHQLRGRVGRGAEQSYCLLLTKLEISSDTRERMNIMVATNDGFRIAEADLKLRGQGDIDGTQQSGQSLQFRIANLATDSQILERARVAALQVLETDPLLELPGHTIYRQMMAQMQTITQWGQIS